VALVLATGQRRPLVVVGGKRATALVTRLAEMGADVHASATFPDGSMVVAPDTARPLGKVSASADLLVKAEQDITDEVDWAATLTSTTLAPVTGSSPA
jgi:hypothetical protein